MSSDLFSEVKSVIKALAERSRTCTWTKGCKRTGRERERREWEEREGESSSGKGIGDGKWEGREWKRWKGGKKGNGTGATRLSPSYKILSHSNVTGCRAESKHCCSGEKCRPWIWRSERLHCFHSCLLVYFLTYVCTLEALLFWFTFLPR